MSFRAVYSTTVYSVYNVATLILILYCCNTILRGVWPHGGPCLLLLPKTLYAWTAYSDWAKIKRQAHICGKIWATTILIRVRGKVRGWVQFCTCLMGNTLH